MNKKIFSALLMGAFALTSVSTLYSCKDYDDDINGLNTEQASLKDRLDALEGNVNQKLPDITSQLDEVVGKAGDLQTQVDEIKTAYEEAGKAALAAQETADAALEKANEALKAAGVDESGKTLLQQVADLSQRVGTLEALKEEIPVLQEKVEKQSEDMATLKAEVQKCEDAYDSLFTMLTSVDLFATFSGNSLNADALAKNLDLMHGTVAESSVFGDNEADWMKGDPNQTFTKGEAIRAKQGVIVRVNPVNADLTTNNVAVKVFNSKGEDLSKYIHMTNIEPYEVLLTSRAVSKSGLYQVYFELNEDVDLAAFKNAVKADVNGTAKDVLFAVAINNTDTVKADRYVASSYDLTLSEHAYENTMVLDYDVEGTNGSLNVEDIHNRWSASGAVDDAGNPLGSDIKEYKWKTGDASHPVPATAATKDNKTPDTTTGEQRSGKDFLPASVNVPFTIKLNDQDGKIAYYYVVLDKTFAQESAPSEWNAWTSYTYTGLGVMTPANETLPITITSLADKVNGDNIGFRVFAVNYDGTLVDPDGRAFYVKVDNEAKKDVANVTITPNGNNTASYTSEFVAPINNTKFASSTNALSGTITKDDLAEGSSITTDDATLTYQLYKADKTVATNWEDAKYIKVTMNDPKYFLDNGTFTFTISAHNTDGAPVDRIVNTLTVNVKKQMPAAPKITFKSQQLVDGVYTCYLDPEQDWKTSSDTGKKDLWNVVTGMDDPYYIWVFTDAQKNADGTFSDVQVKGSGTHTYDLTINKNMIDSKTEHKTTIYYNYGKISLSADGKQDNYVVAADPVNTIFACAVEPTVLTYDWKKKNTYDKDGKLVSSKDVNFINYNSAGNTVTKPATGVLPDSVALTSYIAAKSTYDNVLFTNNGVWKDGLYVDVTAKLISNDTQKEDYFTVKYENGDFVFTSQSGATNPPADVPSTLVIKGTDAFGHTFTIASLSFTVYRN